MPRTKKSQNGRPKESPRSKREEISAHRHRVLRARGLRVHQVGRRRRGRRHRLDGAVSLLRVQAPLPVRDPGGRRPGRSREVRPRDRRARGLRRGARRPCSTPAFDLTEHEVQRNRVLVAEQALVGLHRTSPREEEARQLARSRMRDLEFAWATFLTRGMEQGVIPEADPRLLARAVLGLYNSIWHWYRPGGGLTLAEVRDFYVVRCLAVAGLPLPAAEEPAKLARGSGRARPAAARAGSGKSRGRALRTHRLAPVALDLAAARSTSCGPRRGRRRSAACARRAYIAARGKSC